MTTMGRRGLRATAALTGMAALGVGVAGTAFAEEPAVHHSENSMELASIDGFQSDSVAPVNNMLADLGTGLSGATNATNQGARTSSPAEGVLPEGFQFEMPPTSFGTAGEGLDPTGMAGLGTMGSMGMEHARMHTAGEEQFEEMGMGPMMGPVMKYALPALTGGKMTTAEAKPAGQEFGQQNGLPEPVNGPANDTANPVTSGVMPAFAEAFGTISSMTSNDDTTSNHEFSA